MASILESSASMLNASKPNMITNHPFYPLEVEIANLGANEMSMPVLLSIFTALCATIFMVTKLLVEKVHPHLPSSEKAAIWWFVLCMCPRPLAPIGDHPHILDVGSVYSVWALWELMSQR